MLYQIIAMIVLAVFYGCYFIKMYLQSKKGIRTNQIGKGKVGFVKGIELTMKVVTIAVPLVEMACIFLVEPVLDSWLRILGICIAATGDLIFICAVITMKDSWRAGVSETDKTELVTNGIYQISRNPAFLGFDLVYIGILCMFFHWGLFFVSAFAMMMFHLQIVNVEEEFLIKEFGDEYVNYKKKVCRYFGKKLR